MKVLFVTHYTYLLGANRSMLQLIADLKEKNVEISVLMPLSKDEDKHSIKPVLKQLGIPYIETPIRIFKNSYWIRLVPYYLYSYFFNYHSIKKLANIKFDIVHSNSSVIDFGARLARMIGAKHVWHLREFGNLDYNLKTPFGKWFQRFIYHGNNHFIAISEKIFDHYKPYIFKQPMDLIYNGIKVNKISPRKDNDIINFCVVGAVSPNKGQMDVVKAMDILVRSRRLCNLHLTIVGKNNGVYATEIAEYIKRNELSSYVSMVGQSDNVSLILDKMDIGIMSSTCEAFGRVTVEYMMTGLPVIASDGGANEEIVQDGESGVIYKSGDITDLANKMEYLIFNPVARMQLGECGKTRAVNFFTSEINSNKIYDLYKRIL